jgi:hypothetical protein
MKFGHEQETVALPLALAAKKGEKGNKQVF